MNNTDLKSRLNTYAQNAEKALGGYLKESTEDYKVLIEAMSCLLYTSSVA